MATDARISVGLPAHPKTKKLVKRLGQAAAWNLVCLILWAAANRSDGDLTGMSDEDIELAADWGGDDGAFVRALLEVRFLDGAGGAYVLHDWEQHNPWAAGANRRSEVARANAAKKWGVADGAETLTNAQKRSARLAEARQKGTHTQEEWDAMKWVCGYACVECRATHLDLSKDHILAVAKGGSDGIDNIQPMCHRCNASKGANGSDKRPPNWREMLAERLQNACSSPSPSPSPSPSQAEEPRKRAAPRPCPADVDAQVWSDWLALRKAKKAPVTETTVTEARREAGKADISFEAFLRAWCRRGSQGFEASWLKPEEKARGSPSETPHQRHMRERMAQFAPSAAVRAPEAPKQTQLAEVIDVTARRLG